jgi:hypothetical protein
MVAIVDMWPPAIPIIAFPRMFRGTAATTSISRDGMMDMGYAKEAMNQSNGQCEDEKRASLMKNIPMIMMLISSVLLAGCASTPPPRIAVKNCVIKVQCDKANIDPSLPSSLFDGKPFAAYYCQTLEDAVKRELSKINPAFQYIPAGGDFNVDIVLEVLHGGSADVRFWTNFILPINPVLGAGQSITTVFVRSSRGANLLAETRITETTTVRSISNEDVLIMDVPLVARNIAAFINDPVKYQKETQN